MHISNPDARKASRVRAALRISLSC